MIKHTLVSLTYLLTPWPYSASELYRPSDRRLSAKLVPTSADRGCHVVRVIDPYGRILGFLDQPLFHYTHNLITPNITSFSKNAEHYVSLHRIIALPLTNI
jgi:hypothetical protein